MTAAEKRIEIAELDEWVRGSVDSVWWSKLWKDSLSYTHATQHDLPDYLNSRDAIVPVLEKQPLGIRLWFIENTDIFTTPEELCDALIRETGKWKD